MVDNLALDSFRDGGVLADPVPAFESGTRRLASVSAFELVVLSSLDRELADSFFFDWPKRKKSLILLLLFSSADRDPESDLLPSLESEVLGLRLVPNDSDRRFGMSSDLVVGSAGGPGGVGCGESDMRRARGVGSVCLRSSRGIER